MKAEDRAAPPQMALLVTEPVPSSYLVLWRHLMEDGIWPVVVSSKSLKKQEGKTWLWATTYGPFAEEIRLVFDFDSFKKKWKAKPDHWEEESYSLSV